MGSLPQNLVAGGLIMDPEGGPPISLPTKSVLLPKA